MSSCIVLQQKNNIFIASDTAISSKIDGTRVRLSNDAEKVFTKNNDIIFCSGNMNVANKCKKYIKKMEIINIEKIQDFVSSFCIDGMFEIFIAKTDGDCVESYQLSSYNGFNPIKRVVCDNNVEIFAIGYNVKQMLNSFESNLLSNDVINSIKKTFNDNICIEVGGNVDIFYFYNDNMYQQSHKLNDNTECVLSCFSSKYCDFVIAESLMGKVILGDKLYIGNENNTVVIRPHGISVYDPNATQDERIFLGIDKTTNEAVLRLHSSDGSNRLVLSEQGIYQVFPYQARDSFDKDKSFKLTFYLPNSLQRLDEARLYLNLEKFRSYSKAMSTQPSETQGFATASGGQSTVNTTSASGGGVTVGTTSETGGQSTIQTTSGNGGYKVMTEITEQGGAQVPPTYPPQPVGGNVYLETHVHQLDITHTHKLNFTIPNHTHSVTVTVPNHQHKVSVNIPDHTHDVSVNIPNHTHDVEVTIPSHSHDIVYGIYEYQQMPTVRVLLDGVIIADDLSVTDNFDLLDKFTYLGGTHTLEIVSKETTANPDGLGRASLDLFISGFVSY